MTLPLWSPFAALAVACAFWPAPRWVRRMDWFRVGAWSLMLGFCLIFWFDAVRVAVWAVS